MYLETASMYMAAITDLTAIIIVKTKMYTGLRLQTIYPIGALMVIKTLDLNRPFDWIAAQLNDMIQSTFSIEV